MESAEGRKRRIDDYFSQAEYSTGTSSATLTYGNLMARRAEVNVNTGTIAVIRVLPA